MTRNADSLRARIRARLPEKLPGRLGVAVSGGGDSVALMCLLRDIAQAEGATVQTATVNHGLRDEAAAEAATVATQAAELGLSHDTLVWTGWDGTGNLQDQARQARFHLLTEWAKRHGLDAVALGHTADDQAETVLMRLGRAAGVTGLSAMSAVREQNGILLLRPMLGVTRLQLRDYLRDNGLAWIEDPSNHDTRFDRIKVREVLPSLETLGITPETLSRVADNLAQAHEALARYAQESARKVAKVVDGDVCVDVAGFTALPQDIQRRLVVGVIGWIAGAGYPPRQTKVDQALGAIQEGRASTIGGCLIVPKHDKAWFCRELNAVQALSARPNTAWDQRWVLSGPAMPRASVSALGESGLRQLGGWRETGKPRPALLSCPAVWDGDLLLAAPLAGYANGWRAELTLDRPEFYTALLSH